MSKYLPLNFKLRFKGELKGQWKSFWYRVYINTLGIFLRVPILPMSIDFKYKTFDIWYKGTQVICYFKKGKLRYLAIIGGGLDVRRLSEIDEFWNDYGNAMYEKSQEEINF